MVQQVMVDVTSEVVARVLLDHHPSFFPCLFQTAHVEQGLNEVPVEFRGFGAVWKALQCFFRHFSDRDGSDAARSCSLVISDVSSRPLSALAIVSMPDRGLVATAVGSGGRGFAAGSLGAGGVAATIGSSVSIGGGTDRFSREANRTRSADSAITPAAKTMIAGLAGLDMTSRRKERRT